VLIPTRDNVEELLLCLESLRGLKYPVPRRRSGPCPSGLLFLAASLLVAVFDPSFTLAFHLYRASRL
jgi:hypothetical protein